MSDATFLDNQEVTAEDLNNIAIDLGYPDYSHFPEETPPSAVSALNQITADLVSAGVLLTGNRCAVTYSNGNIYVDTGIIVFESGAKKRIETMQQLQALEGTSCIYALNNTVENTISLVCSNEFPVDGDFVRLASVTGGAVTDTRKYSTAKVDLPTVNYFEENTEEFDFYQDARTGDVIEYRLKKTITFGSDKFNFIKYTYSRGDDTNNGYRIWRTQFHQFTGNELNDLNSQIRIVKEGNIVRVYALTLGNNIAYNFNYHCFKELIVM